MLQYILLIAGFFLLIKGANYLIDGASSLGKLLKIKPLIIGITILAFSTSLPELAINIFSSIKGTTEITLGNVIGSNIANILLILGISSFFMPLKVKHIIVKKGIPFTLFTSILILILANDSLFNGPNILSKTDGIILILFFGVFLSYIYLVRNRDASKKFIEREKIKDHSRLTIFLMIFGGMIALFLGGRIVVDSALNIAISLGFSEFLMSATILAIGTSLPELIVSLVALFKKKLDFVVGNVIGSNIFNIFLILGVSSIITPIPFSSMFNFDLIFLTFITTWLLIFMYIGKKQELEKWNSIALLSLYVFYLTYIFARG